MARFANSVLFTPAASGLVDFVVSAAVAGYMTPAQAGAVTGTYKYRAESADLSQWEIGEGTYTSGTTTLTRTAILFSSTGSKVNFSTVPNVGIVWTKEDMIAPDEANAFTATQKSQIRTNIDAAKTPSFWTRTVLTSGSGTYNTPAGCKAILVKLQGAGGGGAGTGTGTAAAGNGTATTFNAGAITAPAGAGVAAAGSQLGGAGGAAGSGGDFSIPGANGGSANGAIALGNSGNGGAGCFGGAGRGSRPNLSDATDGTANSGSGGGGGPSGSGVGAGGGGGAGAYTEKLIVNPSASYTYVVGAGGTAGTGGSGGGAGGAGAAGVIIIEEFY